jgi:hypothetical protein
MTSSFVLFVKKKEITLKSREIKFSAFLYLLNSHSVRLQLKWVGTVFCILSDDDSDQRKKMSVLCPARPSMVSEHRLRATHPSWEFSNYVLRASPPRRKIDVPPKLVVSTLALHNDDGQLQQSSQHVKSSCGATHSLSNCCYHWHYYFIGGNQCFF